MCIAFIVKTRNQHRLSGTCLHSPVRCTKHVRNKNKAAVLRSVLTDIVIQIRAVNHFFVKRIFFFQCQSAFLYQLCIDRIKCRRIALSDFKTADWDSVLARITARLIKILIPVCRKFFHSRCQDFNIHARCK